MSGAFENLQFHFSWMIFSLFKGAHYVDNRARNSRKT